MEHIFQSKFLTKSEVIDKVTALYPIFREKLRRLRATPMFAENPTFDRLGAVIVTFDSILHEEKSVNPNEFTYNASCKVFLEISLECVSYIYIQDYAFIKKVLTLPT